MYANTNEYRLPVTGEDSSNTIWENNKYVNYGLVLSKAGVVDRHLSKAFYCPSATPFEYDAPVAGAQNIGVADVTAYSSYFFRGIPQSGPDILYKADPQGALVAEYDTPTGPLPNTNHAAAGMNVLCGDFSVRWLSFDSKTLDVRVTDTFGGGATGFWVSVDDRLKRGR